MKKLSLFLSVIIAICLVFSVSCVIKEVPVTETYYETEYRTEYRTETYTEAGKEHRDVLTPKKVWCSSIYFKEWKWGESSPSYLSQFPTSTVRSCYTGFEISAVGHSKSQIRLTLISTGTGPWIMGIYDLTKVGQIPSPPTHGETVQRGGVWYFILTPEYQPWFDNLNSVVSDPKNILYFTDSDQYTSQEIIVNVTGVEELGIITTSVPNFAADPTYAIVEKYQLIWFDEVTKERQVPYQVPYQIEKQRTVTQTKKVPFWEAIFR